MGSPITDGSKSLILRIPVLILVFVSISFWMWVSGPVRIGGGIGFPERRLPPPCVFRPWSSPFSEVDGFQFFLLNVVTGQFGCSAVDLKPVWDGILPYLGQTLGLTAITVAIWSLIGAVVALPTWRRPPNPVSNSFARQAFWFALLAGLLPGILLVWIKLGLPLFSGLTEWIWGAPPRNTFLFPLPILVTGLVIVGIPVNLWSLLTDNSPSPPLANLRFRRILLPLARTNFSIVLSSVVLAEMIMGSLGYRFGFGGRLYLALLWRDTTQLMAIFYLLFAGAIVGNYIVDVIALRLGLGFATAHTVPQGSASETVQGTVPVRALRWRILIVGGLMLALAIPWTSFPSASGESAIVAKDASGELLSGLYNTMSTVLGPALLASILSLAFVASLRKLGKKGSSLLASLLSDSALSVPLLPLILAGFSLDPGHLQRQMLGAAVIFSLVIARGVYHEWPEGRNSPLASIRARVRPYLLLLLRVFSLALAGFTLLGFTLDSLGLFLSPSPSLGQTVYDVYSLGVWNWWQYTIPTVTIIGTAIGLILFSQGLRRMPRKAVSQQTFA